MTAKKTILKQKLITLTEEQFTWMQWQAERRGCYDVDVIRSVIADAMLVDPLPHHYPDPERTDHANQKTAPTKPR